MAIYTDWDAIFNAVTAGILAIFGVWVLTLQPRSRKSLLLGSFAVVHGVHYAIVNLWDVDTHFTTGRAALPVSVPYLAFYVVAAAALFGLARELLHEQGSRGRMAWRFLFAGVLAAALLAIFISRQTGGADAGGVEKDGIVSFVLYAASIYALYVFVIAFGALPLVFAWLFRASAKDRALVLTLSVAFVLWPALLGGLTLDVAMNTQSFRNWHFVTAAVAVVATGVFWLANIGVDERFARSARNSALLVFCLLAFGAVDAVFIADALHYSSSNGPFFGIARLATVVVLAHAILNQQVLGMDVKMRVAISKSTVAAAFITVFFLVSEGAQIVFGRNNEVYGLAAAGGLVFALAPLQRVADRFAAKAVPLASIPAATSAVATHNASNDDLYRRALRIALADRRLSAGEELTLAELSERLGVGARRALELRHEVEAERPAKGRRARP